ncbi:MAG TPA: acylglycerol kinase family protein [Dermatophilaceae bacterium]|nr:acylglycerol kinase family protein [Dermatophilaceae bacterium]
MHRTRQPDLRRGRGHAARYWAPLAERIGNAGATVRVEMTHSREHAIELATAAAADGDVIVAVGGDGLVRDVAGAAVASGCTLGIVPAGRGNDLARALRLPTTVEGLAALLLDGPAKAIDVLDINGTIVPATCTQGSTRWRTGLSTTAAGYLAHCSIASHRFARSRPGRRPPTRYVPME